MTMISTAIGKMDCRRLRGLPRVWLLAAGFALLSACAAKDARQASEPVIAETSGETSEATTVVYECEPAFEFVAQLKDGQAELFLPDRTLALQRAPASTLAIYGGEGGTAFSIFGENARLEVAPSQSYSCASNPRRAVWAAARLRGVDFRATGNEPGWLLEITEGGTILFVADYGERRYEFPTPEPRVHQGVSMTVFQAANDAHALSVTLRGEGCQDTMSGVMFDTRVSVRLDEEDYTGCGKALH